MHVCLRCVSCMWQFNNSTPASKMQNNAATWISAKASLMRPFSFGFGHASSQWGSVGEADVISCSKRKCSARFVCVVFLFLCIRRMAVERSPRVKITSTTTLLAETRPRSDVFEGEGTTLYVLTWLWYHRWGTCTESDHVGDCV